MKVTTNFVQFITNFFKLKGIYNGASFWYTPVLIATLLLCKGIFFNFERNYKEIQSNIQIERAKQSELALEFAKNQNHKKILDLQERYFPHYFSISAENIISEEQIELLDNKQNGEK